MKLKTTSIMLMVMAFMPMNAQFMQPDEDDKYAIELLKVGEQAPDFQLEDINGKSIRFSELTKGKYVVLDFWASWCPDCRKDIPNIQRLYNTYGDRVVFIGVSFDTDKTAWAAAVEKYGICYTQVSELRKFKETAIAAAYGVKWIPSMFLISPDGKVMLGTVLSDKLAKMLTKTFDSDLRETEEES